MSASTSSSPPTERRGGRLPMLAATPGDHPAIYHFLTGVFQEPSRQEFKASLEDPFSEPHDRLLLKHGLRIAGHVHLTHRVMQFGHSQLPVAGLGWLGILPELRGWGYGHDLLVAAEKRMAAEGALVGLLRTRIPHFFRRTGWALCGRHSYSQAGARVVLSALLARGMYRHRRRRRQLSIRPWRRVELAALVRIYRQNLAGTFGPLQRTEAYWQWLIRRKAYDQLYVALDGPDLLELDEANTPIVGYAATRGERIVELLTAPDCRGAAVQLLARACDDAIERDCHRITLHAPPEHRLHRLIVSAGGHQHDHEADHGEVLMTRVWDPVGLLRALGPELHRRAELAGLPRPIELGLLVDDDRYRLIVTKRNVKVAAYRNSRSHLQMNVADFTRLVLGHLDWHNAIDTGRLHASTALALKAARTLFPPLPLWRPPFDDLRAQ